MGRCLYEFFIQLWKQRVSSAYLLDIDRETEKMFYGVARRLNSSTGLVDSNEPEVKFQLSKSSVGTVSHQKNYDVSIVRVLADDFFDAQAKAVDIYCQDISKRVDILRSTSLVEPARSAARVFEVTGKMFERYKLQQPDREHGGQQVALDQQIGAAEAQKVPAGAAEQRGLDHERDGGM